MEEDLGALPCIISGTNFIANFFVFVCFFVAIRVIHRGLEIQILFLSEFYLVGYRQRTFFFFSFFSDLYLMGYFLFWFLPNICIQFSNFNRFASVRLQRCYLVKIFQLKHRFALATSYMYLYFLRSNLDRSFFYHISGITKCRLWERLFMTESVKW